MRHKQMAAMALAIGAAGCGTASEWMDLDAVRTASKDNPAFTRLDEDHNGQVTLQEFVNVQVRDYEAETGRLPLHKFELRRLVRELEDEFNRQDRDGDRRLTVDEFGR